MKTGCKVGLQLALVILLLPQVFVFLYYFPRFFHGGNPWGLLKAVSLYALTLSWVSAPFLAVLTVLARTLSGKRMRWYVILLLCLGAGYLWLALWNVFVFGTFSYLGAAVPILLCSLGTVGWALANALYEESLMPLEKVEKPATDLSA